MSRRAKGHTDAVKKASVEWFKARFDTHAPWNLENQADFDNWHATTCNAYREYMNKQGFTFDMTYGRAQKVRNMLFKYL